MADDRLSGAGVLVTRPKAQSDRLISAIMERGGKPIAFPAIETLPRDAADIEHDVAALLEPAITIFVSPNAVRWGLDHTGNGQVAAIGPTTAQSIERRGQDVDILSPDGFSSEDLLATPAFQDVNGTVIRIIRGNAGREVLATTLRSRGATVEYLAVYRRQAPVYDDDAIAGIADQFRSGSIDIVTIMSVETLANLIGFLPSDCLQVLAATPLVTPANRVIIEAEERFPGIPTMLAKGPQAGDMVEAILACGATGQPDD